MKSYLEQLNPDLSKKLWVYTNYDCNLSCSYCVVRSTPRTPRRAIPFETVQRLVDEAATLGFTCLFFTGGEPFLLPEIYDMIAYASTRLNTTVLTNAMLFNAARLEKLKAIANDNLVMQVSLDGANPQQHDPYRGAGSWQRTIAGIHTLQENGFVVRVSSTETPANSAHLDALRGLVTSLGIPAEDHFIRPLAKRGLSDQGMEVGKHNLAPELTVDLEGVYWHPLSTDDDMRITGQIFPFEAAVQQANEEFVALTQTPKQELKPFK